MSAGSTREGSTAEARGQVRGDIEHALGEVSAFKAVIRLKVMRLNLGALMGSGLAARGDYVTTEELPLTSDYRVNGGTGVLNVTQRGEGQRRWFGGWHFGWRRTRSSTPETHLDLDLSGAVPLDLVVEVGVGEAVLDLAGLNVRSLRLEGGVGQTRVTLPRRGHLSLDLQTGVGRVMVEPPDDASELMLSRLQVSSGMGSVQVELPERGDFDVSVDNGMGEIKLLVPEGLPARVDCQHGFGGLALEAGRFQKVGQGRWQSPGYEDSANRARIQIGSGMGSVRVETA